jgi:hypothetical protein
MRILGGGLGIGFVRGVSLTMPVGGSVWRFWEGCDISTSASFFVPFFSEARVALASPASSSACVSVIYVLG